MSTMHDDKLEQQLRALFDGQAAGINPAVREWDDVPHASLAPLVDLDARRNRKRWAGGIAAIATVGIAATLVIALGVGNAGKVKTEPRIGSSTKPAIQFETAHAKLTADSMVLTENGKEFTAKDVNAEVHSDPGDAEYQTLEVQWTEQGLEQRLYIYFASDGKDWWATELRTRDGGDPAEWIEYMGDRFRTPLGQAFVGDVTLEPTDGQSGKVEFKNLHLQAFRFIGHQAGAEGTAQGAGTDPVVQCGNTGDTVVKAVLAYRDIHGSATRPTADQLIAAKLLPADNPSRVIYGTVPEPAFMVQGKLGTPCDSVGVIGGVPGMPTHPVQYGDPACLDGDGEGVRLRDAITTYEAQHGTSTVLSEDLLVRSKLIPKAFDNWDVIDKDGGRAYAHGVGPCKGVDIAMAETAAP